MVVGGRELIDTLWNVNKKITAASRNSHKRINRYIMECKYTFRHCKMRVNSELIDTLWNVNVDVRY